MVLLSLRRVGVAELASQIFEATMTDDSER